jgi:hypothetical protein
MTWRDVVLEALQRFTARHNSRNVNRQQFLAEELPSMSAAVNTRGRTPAQTVSRILQELRTDGVLQHLGPGSDVLLDQPFEVESTDLPDEGLDIALRANCLLFGDVETGHDLALSRRRRGQARLRALTLANYSVTCAVCDVTDNRLLIASHILAWGAFPEFRGNLANVICLCRFHDALFEFGYWGLRDDLSVLTRTNIESNTVRGILSAMSNFRPPAQFTPSIAFLRQHRASAGLT